MKRILSIIAMFLFGILFLQARTYIVCVGIADYPGRQNDLRVSANDAKTISGIFTKNGNATVDCFVNSDVTIKRYVLQCVIHLPRLRHQMLLSYTLVVMVCLVDWCVTMEFVLLFRIEHHETE